MTGLTDRQETILRFIKAFIKDRRYSPTVREIAEHFRISAKAAQDHLTALKKKGCIESQTNKPRTITVKEIK